MRALVQAPDDPRGPRTPPLPEWARPRLVELSDARADGLSALPVRIVGDPDALRLDPPAVPDAVADAGGGVPTHVPAADAALALAAMTAAAAEAPAPRRRRRRD